MIKECEKPGDNFTNFMLHAQIPKAQNLQSSHQYLFALLGSTRVKATHKTLVKMTPGDNDLQIFKPTKYSITIGTIVEMQCKPGKIFGPGSKTIKLICRDNEEIGRGELVTLDGIQKGSCYPGSIV